MKPSLRFPLLVLVASAGALGTALAAQYLGGLKPCVLCIYQRWPYVLALAAGAGALVLAGRRTRAALVALAGIVFLVGAGIAGFHVGVEQHWWAGTASCGGDVVTPDSLEVLRAQLAAAPVTSCGDVAWSMFGISMAGYNLLASLVLGGVSLAGARVMLERTA